MSVTIIRTDSTGRFRERAGELEAYLNDSLPEVCEGVTVAFDFDAPGDDQVSMVFDVTPSDATLDAALAAYVVPSVPTTFASLDAMWAAMSPTPGSNTWFEALTFEVGDGQVATAVISLAVASGTSSDVVVGSVSSTFAARRRAGGNVDVPRPSLSTQAEGGIAFKVDTIAPSTVRVMAKRPGSGAVRIAVIKSEIVRGAIP